MTLLDLLNFFENYYGLKYKGLFLKDMVNYLNGSYSEGFYESVKNVMIKRHPRCLNELPGPEIIEDHLEEINHKNAESMQPDPFTLEYYKDELKHTRHNLNELIAFLNQETIPYLQNIIEHAKENECKIIYQSNNQTVNCVSREIKDALEKLLNQIIIIDGLEEVKE